MSWCIMWHIACKIKHVAELKNKRKWRFENTTCKFLRKNTFWSNTKKYYQYQECYDKDASTFLAFYSHAHWLSGSLQRITVRQPLFWLGFYVVISIHAYINILNRTVRKSLVGFITLEMLVNIRSGSIINHFVQNSNISSSWRVQILEERISISLIQSRFKSKIEKWHLYKKIKPVETEFNLCKRITILSLFHLTSRGFPDFHRGKHAYSCINPTRLEIAILFQSSWSNMLQKCKSVSHYSNEMNTTKLMYPERKHNELRTFRFPSRLNDYSSITVCL